MVHRLGEAHAEDGNEGRLVSYHTFSSSWDTWEMHPNGTEIVLCVAGTLVLTQESPHGTTGPVTLTAGDGLVNRPGGWHTADVPDDSATVVFITSGIGTQIRPADPARSPSE